jgi:Uma2 family endonuclease
MSTILQLGPADHGRPMSFDEFVAGDYEGGYKYELIDGRLYVTPEARWEHDWVGMHILEALLDYRKQRSDVINYVSAHARVFVPGAERTTAPEPDIVAYQGFPLEKAPHIDWQDASPIVVVEIATDDEAAEKDLDRNVELYLRVPSIQEYWAFDLREEQPILIVHRRENDAWHVLRFEPSETYTTELLPGFSLPVTPRRS